MLYIVLYLLSKLYLNEIIFKKNYPTPKLV